MDAGKFNKQQSDMSSAKLKEAEECIFKAEKW